MRERLMSAMRSAGVFVACAMVLGVVPAQAACPIELAVYGDPGQAAGIDFRPAGESATVTNSFRMVLDNATVLDGIVEWSDDDARRPRGTLMYRCPEGDVTGAELAACTVWQGVIYTSDERGVIALLPGQGADAPPTLIFPDLGPSLRLSAAHGEHGFSKVPWDVFALQGCQE
jgi:hypothetical protein